MTAELEVDYVHKSKLPVTVCPTCKERYVLLGVYSGELRDPKFGVWCPFCRAKVKDVEIAPVNAWHNCVE